MISGTLKILLLSTVLAYGADTIYYYNQYEIDGLKYNVGSISTDANAKTIGYIEIDGVATTLNPTNLVFLQSIVTHCAVENDNLYVLEQVDIRPTTYNQSELSPRQRLLYVCNVGKKSIGCKQVVSHFYSSNVPLNADNFVVKNNLITIKGQYLEKSTYKYLDFNTTLKAF